MSISLKVTSATVCLIATLLLWASAASAGAFVSSGGSTVIVGVSSSTATGAQKGDPPHHTTKHPGATSTSKSPVVTCQLVALTSAASTALGRGGPTPGQWYVNTCAQESDQGPTLHLVWVPTGGDPNGGVDPLVLAQEAADSITLPKPVIGMSPAAYSVVNIPTWLWVDPSTWHPFTATATAGAITATALATPSSVTWTMGDGGIVVCAGPGTPYDSSEPASGQHTDCSYTYRESSVGQPSPDGDPNDGSFPVTATVTWGVTWTVTGAPGGGNLPLLRTTSSVPVRVEQVESIGATS